jgi:N-terminal domain of anti-restriction factor ArdC
MHRRTTTQQTKPAAPNFSELLIDAIKRPGSVMQAYSAFYNYSVGNQLLALFQCMFRGLEPGPIKTFPGWKDCGRNVKRGEKALMLCMPITFKRGSDGGTETNGELDSDECFTTGFMYRSRWFVISQTEGPEIELPAIPSWNAAQALRNLDITQAPFTSLDGNCQGYARNREIAINPVAQLPQKTFFHESAHILLGHCAEADFQDGEKTPKNLREVEAEAVALLCCEALGLEGAEFCRGYIQGWANDEPIPEPSAKKIIGAADKILRAGRPAETKTETAH